MNKDLNTDILINNQKKPKRKYVRKEYKEHGNTKYTTERIEKYADELLKYMKEPKNYWLKSFCISNDFHSEYLYRWAEKNEKMRKSLKKALEIQEEKFVRMGLSKHSNPAFVIFTLKNIAGWRDKQEIEQTITFNKEQSEKDILQIFEHQKN